MPLDYSNPATQRFIIEYNNKANKQRSMWFLRQKDEFIQKAQWPEKHKHYTTEEIEETRLGAGIPALSKQYEVSSHHRRRALISGAKDTNALSDSFMKSDEFCVMKPVDTNEASILYKELAAGGGRKEYLKVRKYKLPEEKYDGCPTTSNVYGWALRDSSVRSGAPEYKRFDSYFKNVTRLSGVHPDPPHYNPPAALYEICKFSE